MTAWQWKDVEGGDDLHLATGFASPRLDQLISVATASALLDGDELAGSGLRLEFTLPPAKDRDTFTGVLMDPVTGRISLTADWFPNGKVTSFVVQVRLLDAGGTVQAPLLYRRIHCHHALNSVWPAPATAVVRAGSQFIRLTVLGRFTDGVVADLTNWLPTMTPGAGDATFVSALDTGAQAMRWGLVLADGAGPSAALDPTTGYLTGGDGRGTGTLSLLLPPVTGKNPPHARIIYQPAWADTHAEVTFVDGGGLDRVDDVPNILFLPDGFTADQRAAFDGLVRDLVRHMCHSASFSPFDMLRDSVNYFQAWLESADACVTLVSPVTVDEDQSVATLVPDPPTEPTGSLVETGRTATVMLDPRETAFHTTRGARPRAMPELSSAALLADPRRINDIDLNNFLGALTSTQGVAVAGRWQPGGPDADLVAIICRSAGFAGTADTRISLTTTAHGHTCRITTGLAAATLPVREVGPGFQEDPAGSVSPDPYLVAAPLVHEFGHAFGLDDEYGADGSEGLGMYATLTDEVKADIRAAPNLLLRDDALAQPAGPDGAPPRLDPGRITWNWPRIANAGIVTAPPAGASTPLDPGDPTFAADGSRVRVTLKRGNNVLFAAGDLVRLRTRPLPGSLLSARHQITAVSDAWPDQILELRPAAGHTDLLATGGVERYPAGSVVLAVTSQAAGDPDAPDVGLVHSVVLDRVAATSNPLNAEPDDPADSPCMPSPWSLFRLATNFPDDRAPNPPALSARLIGLQDAGHGLSCGVYHPSGACIMRAFGFDPQLGLAFTTFCMVCRYLLVDRIDPTCHHDLDARYAREYPR